MGYFVENCETMEEVAERTISADPPMDELPFNDSKLIDLLLECLHKQRKKRKTAPQIVQNVWLTSEGFSPDGYLSEGQIIPGSRCSSLCKSSLCKWSCLDVKMEKETEISTGLNFTTMFS